MRRGLLTVAALWLLAVAAGAGALVYASAAQAQGARKTRSGPGVQSAPPTSQAVSGALAQTTGLSASEVTTQDVCPPAAPGYATCVAKTLVLRSDHARVHPHVHRHASLGRVVARPTSIASAAPPDAGTPAWLQEAYDLTYLSQSSGGGDTVAIVDAYDDPAAEADLATYRSTFGLPPCTTANGCFTKVNQMGNTTPLPGQDSAWEQEISNDLDAVSALCPNCHIRLVEANSNNITDLRAAMQTAATLGANQISDSWTSKVSNHVPPGTYSFPGVATVAGTGDSGYPGAGTDDYPAAFPGVTAAGGTTLAPASGSGGARGFSEGAWSGTGSGCDLLLPKPNYQTDNGCGGRSYADLSADADPATGLEFYDSGNGGWLMGGGTSLAAPLIAAYYAITGVPASSAQPGSAVSAQWAYGDSALLNDPTSGSNGTCAANIAYICTAGAGYDGPTGVGSISGAVVSGAPGIGGPGFGSGSSATYAQSTGSVSASLAGGVYPNGVDTTWWVQYGASTAYGQQTAATDIGSGTAPVAVTGNLTQLTPGTTYHYRLVASNADGTTYGYDYTFTTGSGPHASFTLTPTVAASASPVSLDATASSDDGGSITSYSWGFGDGGGAAGATASHAYASPGVYTVRLTVGDTAGLASTATQTVTVDATPTASFAAAPNPASAGSGIVFDARSSSEALGSIIAYNWTFGDGAAASGPTASHAYGAPGNYPVSLTVTNDAGQTNTTSRVVTVYSPPPPAASVAPPSNVSHTITIKPPSFTTNLSIPKRQKLAAVLKHGLRVVISSSEGCKAIVQIATPLPSGGHGRASAASTLLGRVTRRIGPGTSQITLKLGPAAARKLRGHRRVQITVRVTLIDAYGRTLTRTAKATLGS